MSRPVEALYESIGRRVAQLRARADLTQEQLGQMLEPPVTRASVANLEAGKQRVFVHTLIQFGEIFRVPLSALLPEQHGATSDSSVLAQELKAKLKVEDGYAMELLTSLIGGPR